MNMPISSPAPFTAHIMLETLADGQIAAWVAEVPDCRVIGESKASAIAALETTYEVRLRSIEVIPWQFQANAPVPEEAATQPLMAFAGIFKDDPEFKDWAERFWAEKQRSHDDDEILTLEECLQVM
jgi:hypothetical protein